METVAEAKDRRRHQTTTATATLGASLATAAFAPALANAAFTLVSSILAPAYNTEWSEWTSKLVDVAVQSTISSRLSYMDFSEETTAHFNEVARSMLSMGTGAPRNAPGAL